MTNVVRVRPNFMVQSVTLFLRITKIELKKVLHNGTWSMLYFILGNYFYFVSQDFANFHYATLDLDHFCYS